MRNTVLALLLLTIGPVLPGCALPPIATIVAGVTAVEQIIAAIENVLRQQNVHDAEVDAALLSVHESLEATLAAANVAHDIRDHNLQAAMNDAAVVYSRLVTVLAHYGIVPTLTKMHTLRTAGGTYEVPTPETFRAELEHGVKPGQAH